MNSISGLFRDRAGVDCCPDHGPLRGATKCRFCSFENLPRCQPREFARAGFFIPAPQFQENLGQSRADMEQSV